MNKKQLIRDGLLIGIVVAVIAIIYLISLLNRKPSEVATVNYNNQPLFSVELKSGTLKSQTTVYQVDALPVIKEGKLYIQDTLDTRLEKGKGVIVYNHHYVILGNIDYVIIQYNQTNQTIRVLEETSPYKICSTQGESKGAPIVCLPNLVTITFGKLDGLDGII